MRTEVQGTTIAALVEEHGGFAQTWRDAGIDGAVLYRAMTGRANPSYATRLKLARAFGVRVDEILFPPTRSEAREL